MFIIFELDGKRYQVEASEVKESSQERAKATKATASTAPAGPGPEKASIPAEPAGTEAKPKRKRGEAAAATTPASSVKEAATAAATEEGKPTTAQLDGYRQKMMVLVKGLADAGAGPKDNVPLPKRVVALLLKFNQRESTDQLTVTEWDQFFAKTDAYSKAENGLANLAAKLP